MKGARVLQRIGCGMWLAGLVVLPIFGMLTSIRRGHPVLIGLLCGVAGWFALMSGYMAALSVADWRRRPEIPVEYSVPKWVIPTIWCLLVLSTAAWIALFRRL